MEKWDYKDRWEKDSVEEADGCEETAEHNETEATCRVTKKSGCKVFWILQVKAWKPKSQSRILHMLQNVQLTVETAVLDLLAHPSQYPFLG